VEKEDRLNKILTVKPKGYILENLRDRESKRRGTALTQKEVEDSTGLPSRRLYLYENNYPMRIEHLEKLARYYDWPARDLVEPDSFSELITVAQALYRILNLTTAEITNTVAAR